MIKRIKLADKVREISIRLDTLTRKYISLNELCDSVKYDEVIADKICYLHKNIKKLKKKLYKLNTKLNKLSYSR